MKAKYLGTFETVALEKDKIYDVISIEKGWLRIFIKNDEDYLFPPEAFEIIKEEPENNYKYHYKINNISFDSWWIWLACKEDNSLEEEEPFVYLLKFIAKKLNAGEWKDKICSTGGNMQFTIKNDPLNLVYQWDDLFGIVLICPCGSNLSHIKAFLYEKYGITE